MGWLSLLRQLSLGEDSVGPLGGEQPHTSSSLCRVAGCTSFTSQDEAGLGTSLSSMQAKMHKAKNNRAPTEYDLKDLADRMVNMETQAASHNATLADAGSQINLAEVRRRLDKIVDVMAGAHQHTEELDTLIRKIQVDRVKLHSVLKVGPPLGQPFAER